MEARALFIKTWSAAMELIGSDISEAIQCVRELLRHLRAFGKKAKLAHENLLTAN